jgi:2-methylcitrate dehydratase PrpD
MATETTQTLAKFAATLTYDDLPAPAREHTKNLLLDALACAVAGNQGEETGQVAAFAAALAQSTESSVIGGGHLSLAGATLLNAYLVTATTMCDVHRATMTHVTPEIVPPALMIAERDGLSGRDLLVAIAAGSEVTTRIGIGLDYPVFRAEFLTAKDGGLYNAYVNGGLPDLVTADLGKRFELEQIALRLWPSATVIQGLATAIFDLIARHKIDAAHVRQVRIAVSQTAFDLHGGFRTYKAKFEALLSAHYTAAIILHDHALTLAQFEPNRYDDPKLRAFAAQKVEVYADPAVKGSQAKVDVTMDDGATFSARCEHPLGAFENPLSRAQIEQKFRTYAAGVLSDADADAVVKAVDGLENFGSVRKLMDLLRGNAAPRAMAAAE